MGGIFTGERLETSIFNGNTINHLHRYAVAMHLVKGKTVLDIASGEGYGSHLMSLESLKVYGVDIDKESIDRAKIKYSRDNLEFLVGSTSDIPLDTNSVDVVISYETIEHHDEHEQMMTEIKRVLKPKGTLIISSPDKYFYSDKRNYNNPFHIKELYKSEFTDLLSKYFKIYKLYSQSYIYGSSLILDDTNREYFKYYTGDYAKIQATESYPNFLIAICADGDLQKISNSIYEGRNLIESQDLEKRLNYVYNSNTYKVGSFILAPLKFLKRFF
ncbi:class I SAM-dependent methyltransferase [Lacinutrix himadriensis]|uniref:class I SAM-dependent methyltransferase n=1 Tax=Lacinutrix himadriensis TaxID=641549 RepID=UPI0006E2878D|nr:class I SAM-dependent methyltransferase [Lacinutrix himadriensis]